MLSLFHYFLTALFNIFRIIAELLTSYALTFRVQGRSEKPTLAQPCGRRGHEMLMKAAKNYEEWRVWARAIDDMDGYQQWCVDDGFSPLYNYDEVNLRTRRMQQLRSKRDWRGLLEVLQTDFHRSMCGINNPLLFSKYCTGTKEMIHKFIQILVYVCRNTAREATTIPMHRRMQIVRNIGRAYGHSALMLNSHAAFGLHQLGVIRALHKAHLLPRVIFGVSTGALAAAFVCCLEDIDRIFRFDAIDYTAFKQREYKGSFRRKIRRFFNQGTLMDVNVLLQFARDNLGDITFAEAYRRTGRVLNVQVTRYVPDTSGDALWLLNYLTAPDVLVYTAVVASCATAGVYGTVDILEKMQDGTIIKHDALSLRWTPELTATHINRAAERLRGLFNVTLFIVSDSTIANLPFFSLSHRTGILPCFLRFFTEEFWRLLAACSAALARNRVFRTSFAAPLQALTEDVAGDIVIFPVTHPSDVVKLLRNPEQSLVEHCVWRGEQQVWPHLEKIRAYVSIEMALQDCLEELQREVSEKMPLLRSPPEPQQLSDSKKSQGQHDTFSTVPAESPTPEVFQANGSLFIDPNKTLLE